MNNIDFNTRGYKEYSLNGDENAVIRFNPSDFNFRERLKQMDTDARKVFVEQGKFFEKRGKRLTNDEVFDKLNEADKAIREIINKAFDSDICTLAFGNANCLSFCGGKPMFINFLEAIVPAISKDITEEKEKAEEIIKTYTDQAKNFK